MDLESKTKAELDALQMAKENELQESLRALNEVETKDNTLSISITELQLERKRLKNAISMGSYNIKKINSELRVIKNMIWKRLSEGR